jgi:hypothetical protein
MIIFSLITAATSFALNTAIRGQRAAQQKAEDLQEARTLLGIISRDLRAAYASAGNPNTFFLATGEDMETLLTFTALNHRIELEPEQDELQPFDPEAESPPQSDVSVIRYSFNRETGEFSRCVSPVPNPDTLPEPGIPSTVLSRRVRAIELQFLDEEAGFRSEWNFYTDPDSATAPQGEQGGAQNEQQSTPTDADAALPKAVQVRVILEGQNRRPNPFQTTVTLATPEPQAIGQKPAAAQNPQPGSPGSGGPGQGGPGGGQSPPGGGPPGGGPGGSGGGPLPGIPGIPGARP